jgi:hypothetical protein
VMSKLSPNRDEVLERWMKLCKSWFLFFTKLCVYSSERGKKNIKNSVGDKRKEHF